MLRKSCELKERREKVKGAVMSLAFPRNLGLVSSAFAHDKEVLGVQTSCSCFIYQPPSSFTKRISGNDIFEVAGMANLQIVPARSKSVEAQFVEMRVPLYSYGCEKKVKKALSHIRGIYSVNVDFNEQKVTVWGICNKYDVLATIKKKRKEACFWNPEDNNNNNVKILLEQSQLPAPPSSSLPPHEPSVPSFALSKARSLSWKALKKVFIRSYSF